MILTCGGWPSMAADILTGRGAVSLQKQTENMVSVPFVGVMGCVWVRTVGCDTARR